MDFKLVNLCDHDVVIRDCNNKFHTLPACEGEPARVKTDYAPVFYLGTGKYTPIFTANHGRRNVRSEPHGSRSQ